MVLVTPMPPPPGAAWAELRRDQRLIDLSRRFLVLLCLIIWEM